MRNLIARIKKHGLHGQPIDTLRRHQKHLLFGGGGLLSLLIFLTAAGSCYSDINNFHAERNQVFHAGQQALEDFFLERQRTYVNTANANDAMWTISKDELIQIGTALAPVFIEQGGQAVVLANGQRSRHWLTLGRDRSSLNSKDLAAYLGLIHEYSAYTAASLAALDSPILPSTYVYDPTHSLLAVFGMDDDRELMKAVGVSSQSQLFDVLTRVGESQRQLNQDQSVNSLSMRGGHIISYYGTDPLTHNPSLTTDISLVSKGVPYLHRMVFEPVSNLQARLATKAKGSFLVVTGKGEIVFQSGIMPNKLGAVIEEALHGRNANSVSREGVLGGYSVSGPLYGVDWKIILTYSWQEILADIWPRLAWAAIIACLILICLWTLLLRMDRRIFTPLLTEASRVYESAALSRTIIETSPVGLGLLDQDTGEAILRNEVMQDLASLEEDREGNSLYRQLSEYAMANKSSSVLDFLWVQETGQGDRRHLQVGMASASYQDHAVWVCALRDVTAQAELEENLRKSREDAEHARAAAESASRAKSAFVATMSHEIRTPLNGVLGHLELLARSKLDEAQRERLQRIRVSADSLLAIISDVLDFSRIESGQLGIDSVAFNLRSLIEETALLFAPEAQRKGIKVYFSVDDQLDSCYETDFHRLRQILNNLVSNAVKFTESGRVMLSVMPGPKSSDVKPWLRFQVIDSGIGINEKKINELFEPFSQADASISRRYGGSGLGLTLCKQLSELLGGYIAVKSTEQVGSVFTVDLPVTVAASGSLVHDRSLEGINVTLLSETIEWRKEISGLLSSLGASVKVLSAPDQNTNDPGDILLIFGEARGWAEEEEALFVARYRLVIYARANGPLTPEIADGRVNMSCYTTGSLVSLLSGNMQVSENYPDVVPHQQSRGRVLLVEDNPVNRELMQQQLEVLHFSVDAAENGEDALRLWEPGVYSAVLTDINMPRMDGYELASRLREIDKDVPILAITATALASEKPRYKEAGISGVLLKPFTLDELDVTLRDCLIAMEALPSTEPLLDPGLNLPQKVKDLFVESSIADLAAIREALARDDATGLIDAVHKFKGALLLFGEKEVGAKCSAVESALRDGVSCADLKIEIDVLIKSIVHLLDTYRSDSIK